MATFEVNVTETNKGYVIVEANTRAEAKELAQQAWFQGQTAWGDGETSFDLAEEETCV
jgi:type IV secretory pathway VirD2 relaxase